MTILQGEVSGPDETERELLARAGAPPTVRLACQNKEAASAAPTTATEAAPADPIIAFVLR